MGKSPNNRIGWINTLKGIACWVVFLGHFDDDFPYIPVVRRFYEKGDLLRFISEKTTLNYRGDPFRGLTLVYLNM
jgi:hypothetical protein